MVLFYFVKGKGKDAKIVTPQLTGTLLPGITRDSILSVAAESWLSNWKR
jgi:branched-chain amino acid aminotransferase